MNSENENEYKMLMDDDELPNRFRSKFYYLDDEEIEILREHLKALYNRSKVNEKVSIDDFKDFMSFLELMWAGKCDEVDELMNDTFIDFSHKFYEEDN